jgi:hypothetical protein
MTTLSRFSSPALLIGTAVLAVSTALPNSALATPNNRALTAPNNPAPVSSTGSATTTTTIAPSASYSFEALFNPIYESDSTENTGASAAVNFNFLQIGDNIQLDLTLKNTTNGSLGLKATEATLVGLAFDAPMLWDLSLKTPGGSFTKLWKDVDLNPFGTFSYGISPERNSFAGGNANTGLTVGQQTLMSFNLNGKDLTAKSASQQFADLFKSGNASMATRFQQVNAGGGSDKVKGKLMIPENKPPKETVPEPALGIGLLTVAAIASRHKMNRNRNA